MNEKDENYWMAKSCKAKFVEEFKEKEKEIKQKLKIHQERKKRFQKNVAALGQKKKDYLIIKKNGNFKQHITQMLAEEITKEMKKLRDEKRDILEEKGYLKAKMGSIKEFRVKLTKFKIIDSKKEGLSQNRKRERSMSMREESEDDDIINNKGNSEPVMKKKRRKRRKISISKNKDSESELDPFDAFVNGMKVPELERDEEQQNDIDFQNEKTNRNNFNVRKSNNFNVKKSKKSKTSNNYKTITRKSQSFKPPRFKRPTRESTNSRTYVDKITKPELIKSKWFWYKNSQDSLNKSVLLKDEKYVNGILTGDVFYEIMKDTKSFENGDEENEQIISSLTLENSLLYSLLRDVKNVWFFTNNNGDNIYISRILKLDYLTFDDVRFDKDYNIYLSEFDEVKINKNNQFSYLNISELAASKVTEQRKYEIVIGLDKHRTLKSDIINKKFQMMKDNSLINSDAIRIKIFFNHTEITKENYNNIDQQVMKHGKIGKHGREYKVITEISYYVNFEKIVRYYCTIFSTSG